MNGFFSRSGILEPLPLPEYLKQWGWRVANISHCTLNVSRADTCWDSGEGTFILNADKYVTYLFICDLCP